MISLKITEIESSVIVCSQVCVDVDPIRNGHYVDEMPRRSRAGRDLGRVLEWLLNRDVPDSEIGSALKLPKATYSRRKDADDFPNFAELISVGEYFGVSPR
ncbi:hypothetical protein F0Q45_07495, partial [Mycobacterium simiae]